MRKFLYALLVTTLIFSASITASAYTTQSGTTSPPAPSTTPSGGGGGGGGTPPSTPSTPSVSGSSGHLSGNIDPDTGNVDVDIDFPWSVYTPKVTYLKSVNAALANYDGAPVYFMPLLSEFPTDLTTTVADLTDGNGVRHQFAAVYGGYFDNDVVYMAAQPSSINNSRIQTSKKVYSSEDNSRLLTLLGYDLLLQQERYNIKVEAGQIEMTYEPTRLTNGELTANTCIMDLYKAMGVYEWDIEFAYGVDESLDVETTPIIQMIPALTSGKETKGFDTSESIVWVAATRTNPTQYWNRCLQDAIFDGGLHNITARSSTYIGSETSVSFSLNSSDNVTLGQFCALARAVMTLYGEPVMTPKEQEACLLAYGVVLPQGSYTSEIRDSIIYLAAKGIVDPSEKNFNAHVTFSDIEDILLRIADEGSRLTVKTTNTSILSDKGFATMDSISIPGTGASINVIDSEDLQYYDILIEVTEQTKFYMTRSVAGTGITGEGATVQYQPVGQADPDHPWDSQKAQSTENIAIEYSGPGSVDGKLKQTSGYWKNEGIEEYNIAGKLRSFYHFKVNPSIFSSAVFVDAEGTPTDPGTRISIGSIVGGVYTAEEDTVTSGNRVSQTFTYYTFDQLGFDDTYRDQSSTSFKDAEGIFLSAKTQMASIYFDASVVSSAWTMARGVPDAGYDWTKLFDNNSGMLKTNVKCEIAESLQAVVFEPDSGANASKYRMELYGTNITKVLGTGFISSLLNNAEKTESQVGFYRADDNTLLISTRYLTSKQKISSFEDLGDNVYIMNVRDVLGTKGIETNVVIYDGDSNGFIMVGDTLYPKQDEVLLEQVGTEFYINAKALTGWASDIILVPTGHSNSAIALDASNYNLTRPNSGNDTIRSKSAETFVSTLIFNSQAKLAVMNVALSSSRGSSTSFDGKGFMLTSAYSLSNYLLVSSTDENDYLFVYHIKGQGASADLENDAAARARLGELTGFNFEASEDYYVVCYTLNKADYSSGVFGGTNRNEVFVDEGSGNNLHYISTTIRGNTFGEQEVTWGWTYSPSKTSNLEGALEKYSKCDDSYVLPFVSYNGAIYNLNIAVCKASPTASGFEPLGVLPDYMSGSRRQQVTKLVGTRVDHEDVPAGNVFSDYKVTSAPVGNFALFKASVDSTIKDVSNGVIYWGTTPITYSPRTGVCKVGNAEVDLDEDTAVTRVFLGSSLNSTWVVADPSMNITKLVTSANDIFEAFFDRNGESLVDWEQFSFNRLVSNLDSWASIILIFILNILPRVCILLFFALMLLSLIKDVKPWKAFCNRTFDVYKLLTFGHQSVETIDLKRTVLTSIICLALFYMIMDGALFNFILWISEWVLVLMQK